MAIDPLSPIAPARIRALLLPVGRIKRSRFLAFVDLIQTQCLVRLGDISPDPRPDRNMFSPLAFPNGTLLYDFSTSLPPASHVALSPFEQFREPFLAIGIADAAEYRWPDESRAPDTDAQPSRHGEADVEELQATVDELMEQYPKACLHSLMIFNYHLQQRPSDFSQETILVPPISQLKTTTMKTIICDLTSKLLAEMTALARSIQALPTVLSPASNQTGTGDGNPAWSASESLGTRLGRRNSQVLSTSRSASPNSALSRDMHRMSMPVLPSNSSGPIGLEDPRTASPSTQGARTPPTTFDDIAGVNTPEAPGRTNNSSSRTGSSKTRDSSADRVSIHGFGSGGVSERARNKGRGRISIVIGTLYLSAGQWQDAMRELTEGATRARAFSDHLWHAKALENILVCLLLFSWAGMDFQIPQLCYPLADKSSGTKSPQHTPSNSVADMASSAPSNHEVALENLNTLIPDLINMILNIYNRASNFAGESLPPLAFCECVIRFSKLLAAMNLSAGSLDFDALQHLVQNTPLRQKPRLSVPRLSVNPTRNDIATLLFRALPAQSEASGISPTDRVVVLAGVASILSYLGLQRKKAIVMKEFITSLIPGLIQARKVGAAEMGVHPAAGLAALNMASSGAAGAGALNLGEGEMESGIDEFLGLLGRIYGIPDTRVSLIPTAPFVSDGHGGKPLTSGVESQKVVEEILRISSLRSFGSLSLKLEILRLCIHFCEALPDFNGVIHFTALLLRMAGPGTAPKANSTDVFVSLAREEQVRLYANISKTVAASKKLGLQHTETEYWDDFLVRGIFLSEEPVSLRLTQHRPAELQSTSTKEGPFIHNPWIKQSSTNDTETILVANEEYTFVIALQNPYDFELEVASLRIAADGLDIMAHEEHFILGPYRTQKFPIVAIPQSAGDLTITGCYIKVTGCRERLFPVFPEPWKPEREPKMKKIGLTACLGAPISRPSTAVAPTSEIKPNAPSPQSLAFTVISDQPVVVVSDVSLPQGSVMALEGERKRFRITLRNTSSTTAVDFVHVSFQDSATSAIEAAMSNKDLPPAELHESEVQLANFPSLRWCKTEDEESITIGAGATASFEIEVVGRARLTDAIVQFNYANIGKRRSEVKERFFTRQVSVPISITVNASVQLQRPDILPLSRDFAWSDDYDYSRDTSTPSDTAPSSFKESLLINKENKSFQKFLHRRQHRDQCDEYCMLLLDLRNSWPNPLSISLQARAQPASDDDSEDSWSDSYTVSEIIQPGHVNRAVLVLPKIYVENPHAGIPSLNPANQRQFVVSTSKISPEVERSNREAFWYRDELLKLVRGTWKEEGNGRTGDIELRGIRFSSRMVEAIKLEDIRISTAVSQDISSGNADNVTRIGHSKYQVSVDDFILFKTVVQNRSGNPISPILRLQPHLSGLPHNVALDIDKRMSWNGILQRKLPVILPGQYVESELGLIALCSGMFEIGVTVDEAETLKPSGEVDGNRDRSATITRLQTDVIGEPRLRSWHLKEPCTIVARRGAELL